MRKLHQPVSLSPHTKFRAIVCTNGSFCGRNISTTNAESEKNVEANECPLVPWI